MKTALALIARELIRAQQKHPGWPNDPVHAAAVVAEEAGELVQACLDMTYGVPPGHPRHFEIEDAAFNEAVQVGAMAVRFMLNFRRCIPRPSDRPEDPS